MAIKNLPSTFQPIFYVKIGDKYDKTILPDGLEENKESVKKEKGFLNKIIEKIK